MKQKRGQFYLIAAIIIITMIAGLVVISNYSKKREAVKLYDLGQELGIESENVLDYGTYNELNESEMTALLQQFVEEYTSYAGEGKSLYFIFGNSEKITIIAYQELAADVYVDVGEGPLALAIDGEPQEFSPTGNKVVITIGEHEYKFILKKGENFYFVISQEIQGEEYVVTS